MTPTPLACSRKLASEICFLFPCWGIQEFGQIRVKKNFKSIKYYSIFKSDATIWSLYTSISIGLHQSIRQIPHMEMRRFHVTLRRSNKLSLKGKVYTHFISCTICISVLYCGSWQNHKSTQEAWSYKPPKFLSSMETRLPVQEATSGRFWEIHLQFQPQTILTVEAHQSLKAQKGFCVSFLCQPNTSSEVQAADVQSACKYMKITFTRAKRISSSYYK